MIEFGPFRYDAESRFLYRGDEEVMLPPRVLAVLESLLKRPGKVVGKDEVLESAWEGAFVGEDSLTQAISQLRSALGDDPQRPTYIQTIPKRGYRFIAEVSEPLTSQAPVPRPAGKIDADVPGIPQRSTAKLPWSLAFASLATAAVAVVAIVWLATEGSEDVAEPASEVPTRTSILLPEDAPLAPPGSFIKGNSRRQFTLSSDADTLVYVAWREGSRHELWRYDMASGVFEAIPDTSGAYAPFFDPTGEQVGFFADGRLKTIPLTGSRSRSLAPVVAGHGGAWGVDGFIYFTPNQMTGVHRVSASGGEVVQLTTTRILATHAWPALVQGRGPLRFNASWSPWGVQRLALDGPAEPEGLLARGGHSMYADSGHLVWSVDGVLVASPVDENGLPLLETPVPVVDDVMSSGLFADLARSTLVYARGPKLDLKSLVWVSTDGSREPLALPAARYGDFRISPDGRRLAYTVRGSIWLLDLDDPAARPLLVGPGGWPEWHPSSESLYFTRNQGVLLRLDMSNAEQEPVEVIGADIFPGGSWGGAVVEDGVVFYEFGDATDFPDLHFVPFEDDGITLRLDSIRPIVRTPGDDIFPNIAPDGRWVTYQSDNSGANEVYVVGLAERVGPRQVSTAGGEEPRWSPDGRSIIYQDGSILYSVAFSAEPEISLGEPAEVARGPFSDVGGWGWDIAPDGRFLVLENPALDDPITELVVITGFLEELRRRVPSLQ